MSDYLKHLLIRTPLEAPAQWARDRLLSFKSWRRPDLAEVYVEPARIHEALRRVIREDSNCIDVGCHIGSMLSTMVKLAPRGRHLAFEPVPHKAAWLTKKFPDVDVRHLALGDEPGVVRFFQNLDRPGYSGLRKHDTGGDALQEIEVECRRLDDEVPADRHIDVIKIDVEGGDLGVLRGGVRVLAESRPFLIFECTLSGLEAFGLTPGEVYDFMQAQDYDVCLARDYLEQGVRPLDAVAFEAAQHYPFKAFSFLGLPRG
jgi:FkbM family methyltransferase